MMQKSFPFWADNGVTGNGGFYERLDLSGIGIPHEDSRVRVQARQVFCFALAADLGWEPARARSLVEGGVSILVQDCRRKDGLYGRRTKPGEGLTDDGAEAYDCAFVLLAHATAWKALGVSAAFEAGAALNTAIDDLLMRPGRNSGYAERLPPPTRREQNPHMHLCEASLAWYEATGDDQALRRAKSLAEFVERTFYDETNNVLLEYAETPGDNHVEAGHMFEWVWLLDRLAHLSGDQIMPFAGKLYEGALSLVTGKKRIPLSQTVDGQIIDSRQRTWVQTEALKAHIAWSKYGSLADVQKRIVDSTNRLFDDHLSEAIPGAWLDICSDHVANEDITAATGYHVIAAFTNLVNARSR